MIWNMVTNWVNDLKQVTNSRGQSVSCIVSFEDEMVQKK